MRVRKTSQADADITQAIEYLRERNPEAACAFCLALEEVVRRISQFPEWFPRQRRSSRPELVDVRFAVIRRFGYLVFYRAEADGVRILRVIHGSRNEP
jgi:plasmid stabilization system protein ParE